MIMDFKENKNFKRHAGLIEVWMQKCCTSGCSNYGRDLWTVASGIVCNPRELC